MRSVAPSLFLVALVLCLHVIGSVEPWELLDQDRPALTRLSGGGLKQCLPIGTCTLATVSASNFPCNKDQGSAACTPPLCNPSVYNCADSTDTCTDEKTAHLCQNTFPLSCTNQTLTCGTIRCAQCSVSVIVTVKEDCPDEVGYVCHAGPCQPADCSDLDCAATSCTQGS